VTSKKIEGKVGMFYVLSESKQEGAQPGSGRGVWGWRGVRCHIGLRCSVENRVAVFGWKSSGGVRVGIR